MLVVLRIRIDECCRSQDILVGETDLGIAQCKVGFASV